VDSSFMVDVVGVSEGDSKEGFATTAGVSAAGLGGRERGPGAPANLARLVRPHL
jgi:hypothetical protein